MPRADADSVNLIDSYSFKSQARVELTKLHKEWYKLNPDTGRYEKFVPLNIKELLTPIGLAHWLMGDGYWENQAQTIKICTDSFTKVEIDLLIDALDKVFNIKASANIRSRNIKEVYRIRIAIKSLPLLREKTLFYSFYVIYIGHSKLIHYFNYYTLYNSPFYNLINLSRELSRLLYRS